LPEGIGKRGKSIDALFVRGRDLVAIDNIMLPKWILVYPLEPELSDENVAKFRLPTHTTYENVQRAVEGKDLYALFSSGINHGIVSLYISLIRKSSLVEVGLWAGRLPQTTEELIHEVSSEMNMSDIDVPEMTTQEQIDATLKLWTRRSKGAAGDVGELFKSIKDMAFCGDHLILALGSMGLRVANAVLKTGGKSKLPQPGGTAFIELPLKVLASVHKLESSPNGPAGFYAIGQDCAGTLSYEWISAEELGAERQS
jgi:hypothetical protein